MKYLRSLLRHENTNYFFFFYLIATIISIIFFKPVTDNQFLFIHDQFFRFSWYETFINSLFMRIPENLSVINAWYLTWYFWDSLYFILVYTLQFSALNAEKLQFFLVLYFSMVISFLGFRRLAGQFEKSISRSSILIISLWYCFNPYTLLQWHTGNYNIGLSFTYALAPLILSYLHSALFGKFQFRQIVIFVLLLYLASTVFWLFASLLFFLFFYTFFYLLLNCRQVIPFLRNVIIAIILYIPLVSFIAFTILYQFYNSAGDSNSTFLATYGSQKGGLLYQVLLYSSWAIYTPWYPRTLFSFADYYFSSHYRIATILFYVVILFGLASYIFKRIISPNYKVRTIRKFRLNGKEKYIIPTVLLLILSLFFAKANQPPLGELFVYLYEHFSLFTVFRSADGRFGFPVVLSIALLLLYTSRQYKNLIFFGFIAILLVVQNIFLLNGVGIYGENVQEKFYDRVTYYSGNHKQITAFLNRTAKESGYVLSLPSVQFGQYTFDSTEYFIGQDILAKNITMPFLYYLESQCTSQMCAIAQRSNRQLGAALRGSELKNTIRNFPIHYIVLRRDVRCPACLTLPESFLKREFNEVFRNDLYTVYKVKSFTPLFTTRNMSVHFTSLNPVKYRVSLRNVKQKEDLHFLLSYNKDWKIFILKKSASEECKTARMQLTANVTECLQQKTFIDGDEISYLWKEPLFIRSHTLAHAYANKWTVDPKYILRQYPSSYYSINRDGSINFDLVIYFLPQSWLYMTLFVSAVTGISLLIYLIYTRKPYSKRKKTSSASS